MRRTLFTDQRPRQSRAAAVIASLFTRRMVTRLLVTGLLALDFYCLSILVEARP